MKLPIRLENAITKLYTAFHEGTLDFGSCAKCAVGNIVGHERWMFSTPNRIWNGDLNFSFLEIEDNRSGYSENELTIVEQKFILAFKENEDPENKADQFKGLCAVVEYLCKLDNIPNVMDYTKLFETENNEPKYQLEMK